MDAPECSRCERCGGESGTTAFWRQGRGGFASAIEITLKLAPYGGKLLCQVCTHYVQQETIRKQLRTSK